MRAGAAAVLVVEWWQSHATSVDTATLLPSLLEMGTQARVQPQSHKLPQCAQSSVLQPLCVVVNSSQSVGWRGRRREARTYNM